MNKIFEFDNRIAKEIMIPRKEMAAVSTEMTMAEMLEVMLKENTRAGLSQTGTKTVSSV